MDELLFIDLAAPDFATCSDEVRRARDISWCARTPYGIAVLQHKHAGQILRDRRFRQGSHNWPNIVGLKGHFAEFWQRSIIALEGPRHKMLRQIAQTALSEDHVHSLVPKLRAVAERLCDRLPDDDFDMVEDVSEPFAGLAIAALLGVPARDAPSLAYDASRLGLAMGLDAKSFEATANAASARLSDLAHALLDDPPEGVVARLIDANQNATRQELADLIVITIFGGVDTTRAQLAFAAWLFSQHPDQWTWLRENTHAIPHAIEEVIRIRPTTTWATREALEDMILNGVKIHRGETVHILVHATATDPATGHDGTFDISKTRKAHFGFGGGAHHCLGHVVARTDMAAALDTMVRRWRSIHLAGTPEFLPDSGNTSPLKLPLRVTSG